MAYNVAAILELPPTPATFNMNSNFPSFAQNQTSETTITPSIQ